MLRRSARCFQETASQEARNVIVSGGGLVGAAMMASLQQLRVRLDEASLLSSPSGEGGSSATTGLAKELQSLMMVDTAKEPRYDPANVMHTLRTVSITPVSSKILDNLGGWSKLATKHPYYRIAVRHEQVNSPSLGAHDRSSSFFLTGMLGSQSSTAPVLEFTDLRKPVGFICYNTELNTAMYDVVKETATRNEKNGSVTRDELLFGAKLDAIQLPPSTTVDGAYGSASVVAAAAGPGAAASSMLGSRRFGLLLGCEGRGSPLRDLICTPSLQHDYAQTAYVCNVRLEKVDDGNVCSFQNFFRDGKIIALLPTSEETANIVFSTTPQHMRELMAMPQSDLVEELNQRLYKFAPNDIPRILEVPESGVDTATGKIKRAQGSFPLKLNVATVPYAPRAILLGDAAHGIHPFAGQGLNLGIYDVCALTSILEKAIRGGQDIGSCTAVGQVFAAAMLSHTAPMITGMEVIKKLAHGAPGLTSLGMQALNTFPLLSTFGKDAILQVSSGATVAQQYKGCFLLD